MGGLLDSIRDIVQRVESDINCHRCVHSSYHTGQLYCEYGGLDAYEHAVREEEYCKHFNGGEQ